MCEFTKFRFLSDSPHLEKQIFFISNINRETADGAQDESHNSPLGDTKERDACLPLFP